MEHFMVFVFFVENVQLDLWRIWRTVCVCVGGLSKVKGREDSLILRGEDTIIIFFLCVWNFDNDKCIN